MNITALKYLVYLLLIDCKLLFVYTLGEYNMVFTHPFCMGEIIRLIRHSKYLSFLAIVTEQLYCNGKVFFSYNLFVSTRIAGGFLFHAYSFLLEKLICNAFNRLKPNTNTNRVGILLPDHTAYITTNIRPYYFTLTLTVSLIP